MEGERPDREQFERESLACAEIDHPNVIPVYDAGESDGALYLAMRYVDGCDLADLIHREGPLDLDRMVRVIDSVSGALDAAHARELIHRDVKPGNVLIEAEDPSQGVFLTDFGLTIRSADSAEPTTRAGFEADWVALSTTCYRAAAAG